MRAIILLGIVLVPYAAFASDCRVVEYPDHYEAVCKGGAPQTSAATGFSTSPASSSSSTSTAPPVSQAAPWQEQPQEHKEQTFEALQAAQDQVQQADADGDAAIVISDLGKRHAEQWLRMQPHP